MKKFFKRNRALVSILLSFLLIISNSNFVLANGEQTPQITGKVYNSNDSAASGGTVLVRRMVDENNWDDDRGIGIQGDGSYSISGLIPERDYVITAHPNTPGEAYSKKVRVRLDDSGVPFIVGTGTSAASLDLKYMSPQVVVTVTDPHGNPVNSETTTNGSVLIEKVIGGGRQFLDFVNPSSDGKIYIGALDEGSYILRARPANDAVDYIDSNDIPITINSSGSADNANLFIALKNALATVNIFNSDGVTAVSEGTIMISNESGTMRTGYGFSNGKFNLPALSDGTYYITAMPGNNVASAPSNKTQIIVSNGAVTTGKTININLNEAVLSGTVPNAAGTFDKGYVELRDSNGMSLYQININSDNTFYIGGLDAGTYTLKAYPSWTDKTHTPSGEVTITINDDGSCTPSTLSLDLSTPQIFGKVPQITSSNGGNAYVQLDKGDGGDRWQGVQGTSVSSDGTFVIGGLSAGSYRAKVMPPQGSSYSMSDYVEFTIDADGKYVDSVQTSGTGTLTDPLIINLNTPQIYGRVPQATSSNGYNANIQLEKRESSDRWQWVNGPNVNSDGTFLIGGLAQGTYRMKAMPPMGSSYADSNYVEFTIDSAGKYIDSADTQGTGISGDPLIINLNTPQVVVSVPEAAIINGYWPYLQLEQSVSEGMWEWLQGPQMNENRTFNLGGLPAGTYRLRAVPAMGSSYCFSKYVIINIGSDGKYTGTDGTAQNPLVMHLTQALASGVLRDPAGHPVQNGWIQILDNNDMYVSGIQVGSNGTFSIGGLDDGTYKLSAYPMDGANYSKTPDLTITISGGQLTVPLNRNVDLKFVAPQISGTVLGNGTPQAYGYIQIKTAAGQFMNGTGVDRTGKFNIAGLQPGNYLLKAIADRDSNFSSSADVPVTIDSNGVANSSDLTINLTSPQFTGTVTAGGVPEQYANVEIRQGEMWIGNVDTNDNGEFKIGALEPGSYTIVAYPNWRNTNYCKSQEISIVVGSDGNASGSNTISISLGAPQVKGTVFLPDGATRSRFGYIEVREKDTGMYLNGTGVNDNGQFALGGLVVGRKYILKAQADPNSNAASSGEYEITIGTDSITQNIQLSSPQIRGKVTGPNDEEVQYGYVQIREKDTNNWAGGIGVGRNGDFNLSGLTPGKAYIITAYPDQGSQYSDTDKEIIVPVDSSSANVTIKLSMPQATGTVKNPGGAANASYGWVEIREKDTNNWVKSVNVDYSGTFRLSGLADNKNYIIRAYPGMNSSYTESNWVDFTTGTAAPTLTLTNSQISGTVYEPSNGETTPTRYGWIEVLKVNSDGSSSFVTGTGVDNSGTYKLGGLADGNYKLIAHPQVYDEYAVSEEQTFTVSDGVSNNQTLNMTLKLPQIKGKVSPSANTEFKGAWVRVQKSVDGNWQDVQGTGTDNLGNFIIVGLADGSYRFKAMPDMRDSANGESNWSETVIIGTEGVSLNTLNLALQQILISGTVTNSSSTNWAKKWVEIGLGTTDNATWVKSVPVNEDGTFKISSEGLNTANSYVIQAFAQNGDGSQKVSSQVTAVNFNSASSINLSLGTQTVVQNASKMLAVKNFSFKDATASLTLSPFSYRWAVATVQLALGSNPAEAAQAQPSITSIAASAVSNTFGTAQAVNITVNTASIANNTAITAQLINTDGSAVNGVAVASGTIVSGKAVLPLAIPSGVEVGSYSIKINIGSLNITDTSLKYSVLKKADPSIVSVTSTNSSQLQGNQGSARLTISTANVDDNTPVTVQLIDGNGAVVSNVSAVGTVTRNTASVDLNIPSSVNAGSYSVKVKVLTAVNQNVQYNVLANTAAGNNQGGSQGDNQGGSGDNNNQPSYTLENLPNNTLIIGNKLFAGLTGYTRDNVIAAYKGMGSGNNIYYKYNNLWFSLLDSRFRSSADLTQGNAITPGVNVSELTTP